MSKDGVKIDNSSVPILSGLLGVPTTYSASKDGKTGFGKTEEAAREDLAKK